MTQEKNKFLLIEIENLKRYLQESEQKGAQKV